MVIAACVILEYGVAGAAPWPWAGAATSTSCSTRRSGGVHPRRPVLLADPRDDGTTGWSTCRPIVLVVLCTLLLIRGASESAKVNTIMVLIKLERPG